MDHRVEVPLAPLRAEALIESGLRALVEREWEPSIVVRPLAGLRIAAGSHRAEGGDWTVERSSEMTVLHAPLRARQVLAGRLDHARRLEQASEPTAYGWHIRAIPSDRRLLRRYWAAEVPFDYATRNTDVAERARTYGIRDYR